jgi:hypothetical protein
MKKPGARAVTAVSCLILLSTCIAIFDQSFESSILLDGDDQNVTLDRIDSDNEPDLHAKDHNDDILRSVYRIIEKRESQVSEDTHTLEMKEENGPSMDQFVHVDDAVREQEKYDSETIDANEREPEMVHDDSFVPNFWRPEWSSLFSLF